eukprot:scaffold277004_cov18-Tisochrysis_lutea.AAC.1
METLALAVMLRQSDKASLQVRPSGEASHQVGPPQLHIARPFALGVCSGICCRRALQWHAGMHFNAVLLGWYSQAGFKYKMASNAKPDMRLCI